MLVLALALSHVWLSALTVPALRGDTGFRSPMPGGVLGGYAGDTGLDIGGKKLPVYALAAGTIEYAEWGHTRWQGPKDTAYCIRIALDKPIAYGDHTITHLYYAHLSALEFTQAEGATEKRHVDAGERLGTSGIANGSWHLHLGMLLDKQVEQDDWTYILTEDRVRAVLGRYKNGERI